MRKWGLLLLLLASSLWAHTPFRQPDRTSVTGELLYWTPMVCGCDYAIQRFETGDHLFNIQPDYAWGFRIGSDATLGCTSGALSYLWLQTGHSQSCPRGQAQSLLVPAVGASNYDDVAVLQRFDYQNIDLKGSLEVVSTPLGHLQLVGHGGWIRFDQKEELRALGDNVLATYLQRTISRGIGATVGISGDLSLSRHFTLSSEARFGTAITRQKILDWERFDFSGAESRVILSSLTTPIPTAAYHLALCFTSRTKCFDLEVGLGYEVHYYWRALRYPVPALVNEPLVDEELICRDIGFGGLSLSVRGIF